MVGGAWEMASCSLEQMQQEQCSAAQSKKLQLEAVQLQAVQCCCICVMDQAAESASHPSVLR